MPYVSRDSDGDTYILGKTLLAKGLPAGRYSSHASRIEVTVSPYAGDQQHSWRARFAGILKRLMVLLYVDFKAQ